MADRGTPFTRDLKGTREEISALADDLEAWGEGLGLNRRIISTLNLVLDELITNIVKYGYNANLGGVIELRVRLDGMNIEAVIRDTCPPFNMLETDDPDVSESLESRTPGGLGIYFVKRLADEVHYRRVGEVNEVTWRKFLA